MIVMETGLKKRNIRAEAIAFCDENLHKVIEMYYSIIAMVVNRALRSWFDMLWTVIIDI